MTIKPFILREARNAARGFTLMEVLVSVGVLAFMLIALFSAFGFGFASLATVREDLRATQLLQQKIEAVRLCRWNQLTNCPKTFSDRYDPVGATNKQGVVYGGTLNTTGAATNLPVGYRDEVRLITVTVTWTNYTGKNKIVHTRSMQTYSAYNGLQNYIYGSNSQ